jgi:hypothetical protein
MEIKNYTINVLGTLSFDAKFPSMRKAQNFSVYPMHGKTRKIHAQSKQRWAEICADSGEVVMSGAHNYANSTSMMFDVINKRASLFTLPGDVLDELKSKIRATGGELVGSSVAVTNNIGAHSL